MTTRIALPLFLILVLAGLGDIVLNQGEGLLFLLRRFADLTQWVMFWR